MICLLCLYNSFVKAIDSSITKACEASISSLTMYVRWTTVLKSNTILKINNYSKRVYTWEEKHTGELDSQTWKHEKAKTIAITTHMRDVDCWVTGMSLVSAHYLHREVWSWYNLLLVCLSHQWVIYMYFIQVRVLAGLPMIVQWVDINWNWLSGITSLATSWSCKLIWSTNSATVQYPIYSWWVAGLNVFTRFNAISKLSSPVRADTSQGSTVALETVVWNEKKMSVHRGFLKMINYCDFRHHLLA